jgi:hypothetical protein
VIYYSSGPYILLKTYHYRDYFALYNLLFRAFRTSATFTHLRDSYYYCRRPDCKNPFMPALQTSTFSLKLRTLSSSARVFQISHNNRSAYFRALSLCSTSLNGQLAVFLILRSRPSSVHRMYNAYQGIKRIIPVSDSTKLSNVSQTRLVDRRDTGQRYLLRIRLG